MELSPKEKQRLVEFLSSEMIRRGFELQKDFAKFLGISDSFYTQIIGGKRLGSRQLRNFSKRLNVSVGYLLGLEKLPEFISVPLVAGHIAAGHAGLIPEAEIEDYLCLSRHQAHGRRRLVAVRLGPKAKSMLPTLRPGSLVIIDLDDRELVPKSLYAFRIEDDPEPTAVKRLHSRQDKKVLLFSDNPDYDLLTLEWREDLVIGRVIWSWTDWLR